MSLAGLAFSKMEGCGNSFVVVDATGPEKAPDSDLTRRLCDKNFGIGSDGLMAVKKGSPGFDFDVAMFNPDGSPMGMCGNGIRCVTRFVLLKGLTDKRDMVFNVGGRKISCSAKNARHGNATALVSVNMGEPILDAGRIPVKTDGDALNFELTVMGRTFSASAVSMGNPHCVIFVDNLQSVSTSLVGPEIENMKIFPERTNVEFVEVSKPGELTVSVWERGAGLTLACGTGACASVVAGSLTGKCSRESRVHLPGGELLVNWNNDDNCVYLTGPAREIFTGRLSSEF